jgi:hypothetical protein
LENLIVHSFWNHRRSARSGGRSATKQTCRLSVALNVYLLVAPLQFHVKPRLVLIYAFILPIRFSSTFQHYPPAKRRQVLLVACYLKCLAAVPIPEPAYPVHHEDLPRSRIGRTRGGRKLVSGEISSGAVPSVHFALTCAQHSSQS